jgi:hypothetical protein
MKKIWKNIKSNKVLSRKKLLKKYGHRCFLEPKTLKYPICNKFNGKQECIGHRAAQYYLNINLKKVKKKLNKKSKKLLKKYQTLKQKSLKFTKKKC